MRWPIVAAATSGILLGLAYQFIGVLGFVAYVPLLLMVVQLKDAGRVRTVGLLYVTFFLYHGITNWWICSWQEHTDPYLFASGIALALFHPFFLLLPFYLLTSIRKRIGVLPMLILAPMFITGFEWLHGQTDASYPWLSVGYMLTQTPWGQLAEYVGVYGLTFLLATVNCAIAWIVVTKKSITKNVVESTVLAVLVGILGVLGFVRGQSFRVPAAQHSFAVTIVQPNMDPWDKWTSGWGNVLAHEFVVDSLRRVRPAEQTGLIVWPETAIPYSIRRDLFATQWSELRNWVDSSGSGLLTGFADFVQYPVGQAPPSARRSTVSPEVRYDTFNASMIIPARQHDSGNRIEVHRKSMLTPFAERLPFADQLTFAMSWIEWGVGISAWGKGSTRKPLPYLDSARIGTIICIESIYPEVARDMVRNGADVLCVITNDAWYNSTWGPEQHFTIARMRAIEQRKPLIRCAMSGVSGVIAPDGSTQPNIQSQCLPMHRGAIQARIQPNNTRTFFASFGNPWAPAFLIISLLAFVATRFPSLIRNMHVLNTGITKKPI